VNAQMYFVDIVLPTYKEFERDRLNRRRAQLASLVLYHLLDYVNADTGGKKGDLGLLLEATRKRCSAFQGIEAIANGTKHVEVRGPDHFSPADIAAYSAGTILDRLNTEQGMVREFKTERSMFWFDFKDQRYFVDVALFATLTYLAEEHGLDGADGIENPMQLIYRDTCA